MASPVAVWMSPAPNASSVSGPKCRSMTASAAPSNGTRLAAPSLCPSDSDNPMCAPLQPASASRISFVLWLVVLAAVITGSLLPGAVAARIPLAAAHLTNKDAHFLGYSALAFLSLLAFPHCLTGLVCAAAAVPLGVALEFAQRLVPGRSFEVGDMIANTLGVCAGLALAALLRGRKAFSV